MADKYAEKAPLLDPEAQASEIGPAEQKPARKTFWRQAKALCYVYAAYLATRALVYSVCLYLDADDVAGVQTSWAMSALGQLRKPRADNEALYLYVPTASGALSLDACTDSLVGPFPTPQAHSWPRVRMRRIPISPVLPRTTPTRPSS